MRGFLQPALKRSPSEVQTKFTAFSRGRRTKLAKSAQTSLLKADQWARGEVVTAEVATALEKAVASVGAKK